MAFEVGREFRLKRAWDCFNRDDILKLIKYENGGYRWHYLVDQVRGIWSKYTPITTCTPDPTICVFEDEDKDEPKPLNSDPYSYGPEGETKGFADMCTGLRWL